MKTTVTIAVPNGNAIEHTFPYAGVPTEWIDGFQAALQMVTGGVPNFEYTMIIKVMRGK